MSRARILAAERDGAYWLKLVGDVRLTLCATIDLYVESMLSAPDFASVLIDLREAEGLDSTTLGLLAKLAIGCRERIGVAPTILIADDNVKRILESVGFDRIFDIRRSLPETDAGLAELPMIRAGEDEVKQRVIAAHRVLMGLNEENRAAFRDLMAALGCEEE